MWERLEEKFKKYPARLRVVKKMIELGLRVDDDHKIYCGDLKINESALAKSSDVDRKAIKSTVEVILNDEELKILFKNIIPAGTLLKNIAKDIGLGVVEIEGGQNKGILATTSSLIASKGIGIRQAYAEDNEIEESPTLTIITEEPIPGDIINEFLKIDGVNRVSIY